ncbi:MAG TPA: 23S rRNA (guanosine(2251)-2'-O)-methyltransferase RlmB [Burkholderiaceae bacterium]|jgi:23S rRNA (guanosine2251-2'-O)-methyltransferase|nr:23S rRNA (guanosine(2251)-2'-O)-methyltransferase RlmB [Burkholderiaceae bacterium]
MKARPVSGFHAVNARLKHAPDTIATLYVAAQRRDARMRDLLARAEEAGVKIVAVDDRRLDGMVGGAAHQGVVAMCTDRGEAPTLEQVLAAVTPRTLLLLLDGVTDPRNLGACLRTADAAGVDAVVVPRDRSAPLTAVADKAAAGAAATLPLIAVTNLARAMDEIREAGVWIVGAASEAERTIYEIDQRGPIAWALGAEGAGLRRLTREHCDWLARIPLAGHVESLNVSVAAGICLFETVRQRRQSP